MGMTADAQRASDEAWSSGIPLQSERVGNLSEAHGGQLTHERT